MARSPAERVRGFAFLASGIAAAMLLVFFLLHPDAFVGIHPAPLLFLLGVTLLVALWQANALLR